MQLATSAAAVPAIAVLPAFPVGAEAASSERTAKQWRTALADYRRIEAEYAEISARHDAATAAYWERSGEPNPDFETYGLGRHSLNTDRDDLIQDVEIAIIIKDYRGQHLTADDYADVARRAAVLVDERATYFAHSREVAEQTIGQVEGPWERKLDELCQARTRLIDTPAPDSEAVLFKLSLVATEMKEADADDFQSVDAIRTDAERLFGVA